MAPTLGRTIATSTFATLKGEGASRGGVRTRAWPARPSKLLLLLIIIIIITYYVPRHGTQGTGRPQPAQHLPLAI